VEVDVNIRKNCSFSASVLKPSQRLSRRMNWLIVGSMVILEGWQNSC